MPAVPTYPTPIADALAAAGLLRSFIMQERGHPRINQTPDYSTRFSDALAIGEEFRNFGQIPANWRRDFFERVSEMALSFQSELATLNVWNEDVGAQARWLAQKVMEAAQEPELSIGLIEGMSTVKNRLAKSYVPDPRVYGGSAAAVFNAYDRRVKNALRGSADLEAERDFWARSGLQLRLQDRTDAELVDVFEHLSPTALLAGACIALRETLKGKNRRVMLDTIRNAERNKTAFEHIGLDSEYPDVVEALDAMLGQLQEGQEMFAKLQVVDLVRYR